VTAEPPVGPPSGLERPRFAGPDTFARLPRLDEVGRAGVAVLGVPFDSGVSYRPGARFGPAAVRAGSKLLRPYHPYLDVHPWDVHQVADAGDLSVNPFDLDAAIEHARSHVTRAATAGGADAGDFGWTSAVQLPRD
jgi:agmatinase